MSVILETRSVGKRIIEQHRLNDDGSVETRRNEALGPCEIIVGGVSTDWCSVTAETVKSHAPIRCVAVNGEPFKLPESLDG